MACYAAVLGDCKGGISQEHYISKSIQKCMAPSGLLNVWGIRGGTAAAPVTMGVNAIGSKVLCRSHNSRLNVCDDAAFCVYTVLDKAFEEIGNPPSTPICWSRQCSGPKLELWLLKVLLGAAAAGVLTFAKNPATVPDMDYWVKVLFEREPMPADRGLYVIKNPTEKLHTDSGVEFTPGSTPSDRASNQITSLRLVMHGIPFEGYFDDPHRKPRGPQAHRVFRPKGVAVESGNVVRTLDLKWGDGATHEELKLTYKTK